MIRDEVHPKSFRAAQRSNAGVFDGKGQQPSPYQRDRVLGELTPHSLFSSLSPLNICQGRIIPSNYTDSFHCVPTTQQWGFVSRSTSGSSRTQTGAHSEDWIDPLSTELRSSTTEMNFVFLSKFTHCQTPAVTQEQSRSQF